MDHPAPDGVTRRRLPHLGAPATLLRRLPPVTRLVALVGAWHQGEALVSWDPLHLADDPFGCEAGADQVDGAAFGGGWIGVWGYQLRPETTPSPTGTPPRPVPQPHHRVGYYDRVLRLVEGEWWFEQLTGLVDPAVEAERAAAFLDVVDRAGRTDPSRTFAVGRFTMTPSPEQHREVVARTVRHIADGDIFQANLTARLEASFEGDALAMFCRGVEQLAPAYAAFVSSPEGDVASLSPELFLRRRGRHVVTRPIKGTAPLSTDPALLAGSGKDRAENVMIVDLMRNDLGRVAEPGTVVVPAVNQVERHAVWHLVSEVSARLRDGVGDGDLLRATFPPGSVTGAPKIRALEVIDELEATARETYTGAIGHLSPHAGLELNVAIRTFEVAQGRVWLGVGGGIVHDSDPAAELVECFTKARPLLGAIGASLDEELDRAVPAPVRPVPAAGAAHDGPVFDTLLVRDGLAVDPEPHLRRLADSARTLWGTAVPDDLADLVRRHARPLVGEHRLRLDLAPAYDGQVRATVTHAPLGPAPATSTLEVVTVEGGLGAHKWAHRPVLDAGLPPDRDQLVVDVDGTVLEAGRAAVLAVVADEVRAPLLDGRQLPSTGRRRVASLLDAFGMPLVERRLTVEELGTASEVFTVNALRSVVPVVGVPGVGEWPVGPVARWLRDELAHRRTPSPVSAARSSSAHVLFVDNYDSFVYNLVQHVAAAGARATVVRNDAMTPAELEDLCREQRVTHVVVSPGPGTPEEAGVSVEVVRRLGPRIPLLGVCLGHQAIAVAYGARVHRSSRPMHGKPSLVWHDGAGVHAGMPQPAVVGRYHSLVVDASSLPPDLEVTSASASGVVMGLRHRHHPVEGVQWHPESVLSPHGGQVMDRFLQQRQR